MGKLDRRASAMSDGSGNLTITFPPVPFRHVWTGTMRVLAAPAASSWTGARNGIDWAGVQTGGAAGVMEGTEGDTISLTGTGYTPSTTYTAAIEGNDVLASEVASFASPFPAAPTSSGGGGGGGLGSLLAYVSYATVPPHVYNHTFSATPPPLWSPWVAVDGTNLAITFTPTSAKVLVRLTGYAELTAGAQIAWGVAPHGLSGFTDVLAAGLVNSLNNTAFAGYIPQSSIVLPVTGLTAGTPLTWDWMWNVPNPSNTNYSISANMYAGGYDPTLGQSLDGGPLVMEVFAA